MQVTSIILGDSAFPLIPWLMKPYTNAASTPRQHFLNYRLSWARMVTEGAFGRLKSKCRILLRKCESKPSELTVAALACIIIHNIFIDHGDTLPLGKWMYL